MKCLLPVFPAAMLSLSCSGSKEAVPVDDYSNPVISFSLPDPTVLRDDDGYFYLYATEDTRNIPIMRSADLVSWRQVGTAFTNATRPTFLANGSLWAPDIAKIGDKYVLYYALSKWGETVNNGVGVATAASPRGPFTDVGKLFTSAEIGVKNSIDEFFIEDGGKNYLIWGSYSGIYCIELADNGLSVKTGATKVRIAWTAFEGTDVFRRNGYYYLFASTGTCCNGVNSTYRVVVGRSRALLGPYTDKNGGSMLDNKFVLVLKGNDHFAGPGHNARIMTDDALTDWMLYHAYDRSQPDLGRVLMLDRITWVNDWPVINDGTPSKVSGVPSFK